MNYSLKLSDKRRYAIQGTLFQGLMIFNSREEALFYVRGLGLPNDEDLEMIERAILKGEHFKILQEDGQPLIEGKEFFITYSADFEEMNSKFFK